MKKSARYKAPYRLVSSDGAHYVGADPRRGDYYYVADKAKAITFTTPDEARLARTATQGAPLFITDDRGRFVW